MIKYVNKLKVENISEFYIMISLYEYFLKDTFSKPCVTGLQPLCGQCPVINPIKRHLKRHLKKIFKKDI